MDARRTTDELSRLAGLPELDDRQLDFMVAELGSTDSWIDHEDGGYGSLYSAQYEIKVSDCAELALSKVGAHVLPRLVQRLRRAQGRVHDGLLKALSRVDATRWATLTLQQRTDARKLIELAVGSAPRPFATLQADGDELTVERARDLISLRLLALDAAETGVERALEPVVQALQSPSSAVRRAASEVVPFLRASTQLGDRLLQAFFASRDSAVLLLTFHLANALAALEVPRDDAQRARLVAVLEDGKLGDSARELLTRGLSKAEAAEKVPHSEARIAAEARALTTNTNEGAWRDAFTRFGHATIGRALVPVLRERLLARTVSDEILHHMALVGPALAPLAEHLLPYLTPATSPSWRHVRWATAVFESIKSPLAVPALEALLKTDHERHARRALEAISGKS